MEELKSWGGLLLFVSAGSLIYCFLLPAGAVSKIAKSVISVVFICAAFMPLSGLMNIFSDAEWNFTDEAEEADFSGFVEESARSEIEKIIHDCVRKYTSVPYDTEIFINITDDLGIRIEYVRLIFSASPLNEEGIRDELTQALGIIPDIRVELTGG